MVHFGRLEWITRELARGRQCRVRLNTAVDKVVVHFVMLPGYDLGVRNMLVIHFVEVLSLALPEAVVTDHGHQKSSGESHISFILKPTIPYFAAPYVHGFGDEVSPSGLPAAEVPTRGAQPDITLADLMLEPGVASAGSPSGPVSAAGPHPARLLGLANSATAAATSGSTDATVAAFEELQFLISEGVLHEIPDVPTSTLSDVVQRVLDDVRTLHSLIPHSGAHVDSSLLERAADLKSKGEILLGSIPATSPIKRMPELIERVTKDAKVLITEKDALMSELESACTATTATTTTTSSPGPPQS